MQSDPELDRASLAALQRGDTASLNRLIARWQRPLIAFAYRYVQNSADAHDLVAEVFVKLYQQRDRLRADTHVSAWLFTALTNLCHNLHRWKRRHPTVPIDAPNGENARDNGAGFFELATDRPGPDHTLAHEESHAVVKAAIHALPHDLKTTVLLHHYEHLSYREIGRITGCSERGVETRLYRARQQLKIALAEVIGEASAC